MAGCNRRARVAPDEIYRQARASFDRGELIEALGGADRGLQTAAQSDPGWAFRFRVLKAEVLAWQGKPKESLALLEGAVPASLSDPETSVRRDIALGTAERLLQRYDDAAKALADAEKIATAYAPALLADVAMGQATLATYQHDFALAGKLNLRALDIARRDKRPALEANALGSLGFMALREQRYGAAVDWFTPSLRLSQQVGNRTLSAKTLGNLGWCYFKMGDYDRAAEMFKQAERLSADLGLAKDQFLWLTNIGSVDYERRDYAAAADQYQKALSIARKLANDSGAAVCLNNLAATALEMNQYDAAERYNREALELKRTIGDPASELYSLLNAARIAVGREQFSSAAGVLKRIVATSGDDASLRWEAQSELASVYALQGDNASADQQFRSALATIDAARAALSKEEYRLSFLASAERFYNDYLDFLVSRGRAREALLVAEHSRARTLAEGLRVPVAGIAGGIGPEEAARKMHAAILSYWLKPGHSYLWAVTPSRIEVFSLPAGDQIEADVRTYRNALMGPRDVKDTANASGTGLYKTLVQPAERMIGTSPRVVIVASGTLNSLNFETLLAPTPQIHYWIEDVVVTNASSIALLGGVRRDSRIVRNLLLIGDPEYNGTEFQKLAQAQLEIRDIAQHFATSQRTVLEGAAATASAYQRARPGGYAYIHFVAHGTASQTSPLDSSIILSQTNNEVRLYARDIMQQPLRADLVTISACYGAGNRSYAGEGLVGLAWAFLRAGAHSAIAALWEVSDESTPQLMDTLYARLQAGEDPASALREAKLTLLRSGSVYRRPFYWGAFQFYSGL